MRFWDSSALIPLCLAQPKTKIVRRLLKDEPSLAVWWATVIECASAFARLRREGTLTASAEGQASHALALVESSWTEIEPSQEVRERARRLLRLHPLRAADSLQLAAALVWAGKEVGKSGFVCLDHRLREAARAEGFVLFPAEP